MEIINVGTYLRVPKIRFWININGGKQVCGSKLHIIILYKQIQSYREIKYTSLIML